MLRGALRVEFHTRCPPVEFLSKLIFLPLTHLQPVSSSPRLGLEHLSVKRGSSRVILEVSFVSPEGSVQTLPKCGVYTHLSHFVQICLYRLHLEV